MNIDLGGMPRRSADNLTRRASTIGFLPPSGESGLPLNTEKTTTAAISKRSWGKPPRAWVAGLLFILAVAAGASVLALDENSSSDPASCPAGYKSKAASEKPASESAPLVPIGADGAPAQDPSLNFAFGSSRGALTRSQAFRVPDSTKRKTLRYGFIVDLIDDETNEAIPAQAIAGRVRPVSIAKRAVSFRLCIDPTPEAHPEIGDGTYTGTVKVGRPAMKPDQVASVPITVTISDGRRIIAMLAVLIGVIVGLVVRATGDLTQAPGTTAGSAPMTVEYVYSLRFLVTLAGGLLAGALVYGPVFADKADGTIGLFDSLLPLAAAAFTATLAAKSLADLRSPTQGERVAGVAGHPEEP